MARLLSNLAQLAAGKLFGAAAPTPPPPTDNALLWDAGNSVTWGAGNDLTWGS